MLVPIIVAGLLLGALVWLRARDVAALSSLKDSRALFLAAAQGLVLALQLGSWVLQWFRRIPQPYPDFIVGEVGLLNQNKQAEYYALYAAVAGFFLAFFLISQLHRLLLSAGVGVGRAMVTLSLYALIPAMVLAGQTLRVPDVSTLLALSSLAIVLSLAAAGLTYFLVRRGIVGPRQAFETGASLLVGSAMLGMSDVGLAVALSRVKFTGYHVGTLSLVAAVGFAAYLLIGRKLRPIPFRRLLSRALYLCQGGVPLLFAVLASPPVRRQDGTFGILHYTPAFYVLILALIALSLVDLYRRFRRSESGHAPSIPDVSPLVLAAILVYVHSWPQSWPSISPDDFHAGESYLPWWLLNARGYLPFVDYQPSRGLINYVLGFFSWLFFDNTASGQVMVVNTATALYVLMAFYSLRLMVGDLPAFIAAASVVELGIDPVATTLAAICGLMVLHHVASRGRLIAALWLWLGLCLVLPLFAIAEGSIFVLASMPVGLFTLFQALRTPRVRPILAASLGVLVIAAVLLAFTTPVLRIIAAALRYLLEQSSVNDVAHGIPWSYPGILTQQVTSGSLWQFVRFSWLLLIVPIALVLARSGRRSSRLTPSDMHRWLLLVSLLVMAVLLIPRAAGRIDSGTYSRPWFASIALVSAALPVVVLSGLRDPARRVALLLMTALALGVLGDQEATLRLAGAMPHYVLQQPARTVAGKDIGLDDIGSSVIMDSAHLQRQLQINEVLTRLLKPGETYYDVTNHSSDYAFQNRPSPVSDTAIYNVPSWSRQQTVLSQLDAARPSLALISAENLLPDWAQLPLRASSIYKYLLANYIPFADQYGRIWMIRRGSESRLRGTDYSLGGVGEQVLLLQTALAAHDLQGLPAAWGRSLPSLQRRLGSPVDLLIAERIHASGDLEPSGSNSWTVVGPHPSLVVDLDPNTKRDMLYLSTVQEVQGGPLKLFWRDSYVPQFTEDNSYSFNAGSAEYLIPLSAAPSWELAAEFHQLRIDLPEGTGQRVQFKRIVLYSRIDPD